MAWSFEWDLLKAEHNLEKHGVSFETAMEVFADRAVIHLEDPKHSSIEDRYYAVGKTLRGVILTVRYTVRGQVIRIFGAAKWRKWETFYEKNARSPGDEAD